MNELISEIKNNLVPPVGGRIITTNDGQVAWVGFGNAVVDKDEELDVQAELDLEAERTAEEIKAHNDRVRNMRNATASVTNIRSLRSGVLSSGIVRHTEIDDNGYFAYGIAVYSPGISAKVNEASREMDEAQIVQPLNDGRDSNGINSGSEIIQRGNNRQKLDLQMMKGSSGIVNQDL